MEPSFSPAVDIEKVKGKETGVIKSKSIVHGIFLPITRKLRNSAHVKINKKQNKTKKQTRWTVMDSKWLIMRHIPTSVELL